ncbi:hypothetical protein P3342_003203 [Pyrenophora teres f. teres]|nr:hypothetical protein P3342_003203 [Pyrenophora teres f. teres]
MAAMVDFSQLLSLSISGCDESDFFFHDLGVSLANSRASIKHIYATVSDTDCLTDVLKHSENLTSLHLVWPEGWKETFWKTIQRIGPHLESLGLHHSRTMEPISANARDITTLQALSSCSKVRQLGIQLSHHDLDVQTWNTHYMFKAFLANLKHLPDLRTLHFRYPRWIDTSEDTLGVVAPKRWPQVTFELQRFANVFFQFLETRNLCPRLNSLAIGVFWEPRTSLGNFAFHIPRHCFIKGYQTDALGRTTAVGVPVSVHTLRTYEPESDILDLDPDCEWVGSLPEHFQVS